MSETPDQVGSSGVGGGRNRNRNRRGGRGGYSGVYRQHNGPKANFEGREANVSQH
jgi:hypothetical protein